MSDSHHISIEALDQLQQLLLKIPPHHRALIQLYVDRGAIYEHVLQHWVEYLDEVDALPIVRNMMWRLIAHGTPNPSGSGGMTCRDPGDGPAIQAWLGVGKKSGQLLARWLRECPLIKTPHPDLPGHLIVYGRAESLRQGDAYPQLPLYSSNAGDHRVSDCSATPPSGASAPGGGFSRGATPSNPAEVGPPVDSAAPQAGRWSAPAPRDVDALAPPAGRWGALPSNFPEHGPKLDAVAPLLLGKKVGRYEDIKSTSLPSSPSTREKTSAAPPPTWLPEPDLDSADPEVVDELTARFMRDHWLDVFSRCSEVSRVTIRAAADKAPTPGIFGYRLAQQVKAVRAKRRVAERHARQRDHASATPAKDAQSDAEMQRQLAEARAIVAANKLRNRGEA